MAVGGDVGVGTCVDVGSGSAVVIGVGVGTGSVIGVCWLGTTTGVAVGLGMAVSAGAAAGTGVAVGSGVLGSAGTVGMGPSFTTGVGVESSASTSILIRSVGSGSPWQPRARARITRANNTRVSSPGRALSRFITFTSCGQNRCRGRGHSSGYTDCRSLGTLRTIASGQIEVGCY